MLNYADAQFVKQNQQQNENYNEPFMGNAIAHCFWMLRHPGGI